MRNIMLHVRLGFLAHSAEFVLSDSKMPSDLEALNYSFHVFSRSCTPHSPATIGRVECDRENAAKNVKKPCVFLRGCRAFLFSTNRGSTCCTAYGHDLCARLAFCCDSSRLIDVTRLSMSSLEIDSIYTISSNIHWVKVQYLGCII